MYILEQKEKEVEKNEEMASCANFRDASRDACQGKAKTEDGSEERKKEEVRNRRVGVEG